MDRVPAAPHRRSERQIRDVRGVETRNISELVKNPAEHMYLNVTVERLAVRGDITKEQGASILTKINEAGMSDGKSDTPRISSNEDGADEANAFLLIRSELKRSAHLAEEFRRDFPPAQAETILHWTAKHASMAGAFKLSGIIESTSAHDGSFLTNLCGALAYADPDKFQAIRTAFRVARNIEKEDSKVEKHLEKFASNMGINEDVLYRIVNDVSRSDWQEQLEAEAKKNTSGSVLGTKWSGPIASLRMIATKIQSSLTSLENATGRGSIERYRERHATREKALFEISSSMEGLTTGTAGNIILNSIMDVSLRPDAKPETVTAAARVEEAKKEVRSKVSDEKEIVERLKRLKTAGKLPNLDTPDGRDQAGRLYLSEISKEYLERSGPDQGGFVADLWKLMTDFFGSIFGSDEVQKVGNKISELNQKGSI